MKIKKLIYPVIMALMIFGCSSSSTEDLNDQNPNPDPNPITKVTYDADIKSIISSRCIGCHGNPPTQGAPFSLTTYNDVKSRVAGIISRIKSSSNPMPPAPNSPLTPAQIELIEKWQADGLLEN
ncbi:hypothetical protein [Tamlana flava]|uniref:hypothetical protein n=1 Tax=Tamlana flava TaxID=3158572 RepID=UPI00351B5BDA